MFAQTTSMTAGILFKLRASIAWMILPEQYRLSAAPGAASFQADTLLLEGLRPSILVAAMFMGMKTP
jgi:hypothetical protein